MLPGAAGAAKHAEHEAETTTNMSNIIKIGAASNTVLRSPTQDRLGLSANTLVRATA